MEGFRGVVLPAERLYMRDSYLREFEAVVTRVEGRRVFLDRTAFHPRPVGGLDADRGWLVCCGRRVAVEDVVVEGDDVAHVVAEPPWFGVGASVRGVLDWGRRYALMRMHTAVHVIVGLLYSRHRALVTGVFVGPGEARIDFDLGGVEDWRGALAWAVEEANRVLSRCLEVRVYWLSREEAEGIEGLVKLAGGARLGERVRIVEIPGVDVEADEGPHVRNTCEVGRVELVKLESRGRRRRRLYARLADRPSSTGGSGEG